MILDQEYVGSICEMKTMKNEFIAAGKIRKIGDRELEIYDPDGPLPIISYRTSVIVTIFNSTLGFKMLAGQVYISNRESIRVVEVQEFIDYERRRFFRVDIDVSGAILEEEEDGEVTEIPIRIKNLSLCGLMFETDRVYDEGDKLTVKMALYKNKEEDLHVIIQRMIDRPDGIWYYGSEIVEMNKVIEQNLCAFLFDQQRQQILRNKIAK